MKTYWKFILIFGILMMDFYLLMTFLFKENDGKKVKETENILDQLGLYEIMQLIFMYTIKYLPRNKLSFQNNFILEW